MVRKRWRTTAHCVHLKCLLCHPDDLTSGGILSKWLMANAVCHPDDIRYLRKSSGWYKSAKNQYKNLKVTSRHCHVLNSISWYIYDMAQVMEARPPRSPVLLGFFLQQYHDSRTSITPLTSQIKSANVKFLSFTLNELTYVDIITADFRQKKYRDRHNLLVFSAIWRHRAWMRWW